MLGHIFENLLEDNKDKGAFYTPKEIVHYMCQESLIEYLTTWFEGKNYQVKQDTFISFDNSQQASFLSANEGNAGQSVLEITHPAQSNSKVINRSLIEKLLKKQLSDEDKQAVKRHAAEFNDALDKVKICDPAIGSGAFPMGLLLEIFTAKQTIHVFEHSDLISFEPAKVKLNIIQNSIYGVDIERGAVDIARLRFWLSLVVDEPHPQPLPNLDYKIVVGNSLISKLGDDVIEIDWDVKKQVTQDMFGVDETSKIKQTLNELNKLQKEFFNPNSDKKNLAPKIRNLKIDLLIQQLNLMIETRGLKVAPRKLATQNQKDFVAQTERHLETQGWLAQIRQLQTLKTQPDKALDFFDWQLNFAEVLNKDVLENGKVGFDIVIGNPPYIRQELFADIKDTLKAKYKIYHSIADLLTYFVELSYNILAPKANFSFIISNKFTRTNYGQVMREFLLKNTALTQFIDFSGIPVFENATVDAAILGFKKESLLTTNKSHQFRYLSVDKLDFNQVQLNELLNCQLKPYPQHLLTSGAWAFENSEVHDIKHKVEMQGLPLQDWDISINYGIKTVLNEAFVIDSETKNNLIAQDPKSAEVLKPLLRGRDIQKYQAEFQNLWLIGTFPALNLNIEDYPAVKKYLSQFGKRLDQSGEKGSRKKTASEWFETQDNIAYWRDFEKPKIIYPNMTKYMPFALDLSGTYYHNDKSFHLVTDKIYWLSAMLNSRLFDYCFRDNFPELLGGTRELRKVFFDKIPIKQLSEAEELPFKHLVTDILTLKDEKKSTLHIEYKIDVMIYKLYCITFDEVKVIDPDFTLSEAEYSAIVI